MKRVCGHCSSEFENTWNGRGGRPRTFCSKECRATAYRLNNPEKIEAKRAADKTRMANFYRENRDLFIARAASYAQRNPEKVRAYKAKYSQTANGRERDYEKRRRRLARLRNAFGGFTRKQFRDLCESFSNRCLRCGERKKLEADHVRPLVCGGSDDISNIQPLCRNCNARKATDATDYRPKNLMGVMFSGLPVEFIYSRNSEGVST